MYSVARLTLVLAAASALATPAFAQSEPGQWTAFYVGASLGYNWQPSDGEETILFDRNLDGKFGDSVLTAGGANAFAPGFCGGQANSNSVAGNCSGDREGADVMVHAGYDRQLGNIVVGVVGEYGRSSIQDRVTAFSSTPASYTISRRLRDHAQVRARVGYALDKTLLYATGGGAYGNIRNIFTSTNRTNLFTGNGNEDAWGYVYGGGIEQLVAPNFSIGAMYQYTSLDAGDYRVRATGPAGTPFTNAANGGTTAGTDFKRSMKDMNSYRVMATASFRF